MSILLPLAALILPFALWPIEFFLPYPFIIEEIAKAVLLVNINTTDKKTNLIIAAGVGIAFSLSESMLFMINLVYIGGVEGFFIRLITSSILHIGTCLVLYLPAAKNKKLILFSLPIAILIHYFYNLYIPSLI